MNRPVGDVRARMMSRLPFRDVEECIRAKAEIEAELQIPENAHLIEEVRGAHLKMLRELWAGIVLAKGVSVRFQTPVEIAASEADDYDVVLRRYDEDGWAHVTPVQLKSLPSHPQADNTLQATIDALRNYPDSRDLSVCIVVERDMHIRLADLNVPCLAIASLWLLLRVSRDGNEWVLVGDLHDPTGIRTETRFCLEQR